MTEKLTPEKPATDKPMKVFANPYKNEGSSRSPEDVAKAMLQAPDVATILNNQRCAFEAVSAATEKLLEGATEISRKHLALQSTLMRQAFRNTLDYWKSDGKPEERPEVGTDIAFEAMRDIASTALKCNLEALSAFSDRIRRMGPPHPLARSHPAQAAD